MVKFGERLPGLMVRGWEIQYIDYDALKKILDSGTDATKISTDFYNKLESNIMKVDRWVEGQLRELQKAYKAAHGNTLALEGVKADLDKLRRYVGTNIIAATKIVKKHDKNVQDSSLQKRDKVAGLILSCASFKKVPIFQQEILGGKTNPSVAIEITSSMTSNKGDDDDNDTEQTLRSLPAWLMSGAVCKENEESKHASMSIITTYVKDWTLEEEEPTEPLNGTKPSAATASGDGFDVTFTSDATRWADMGGGEKAIFVLKVVIKLCIVVLALYAFICSLSFLADGFRLVAGRQAGQIFQNSEVFNNPIAGMLVGVLVTVLVQSSSTSTSIVITMVAADLLTVRQAISLIMGANIGTSVTSTIVALSQSVDRGEFRRAFAAATVHDMFNFLTVLVFLPLEAATGYLYNLSLALINASPGLQSGSKPPDILKALTKPFTKLVGSLDKNVITKLAVADTPEALAELEDARLLKYYFGATKKDMSDAAAGVLVLIVALAVLCTTLFVIVYTLKSLLKGQIAIWLHKSVNGNVPDIKVGNFVIPMGWLSGYLAMVVGLFVTIAVQSSSITTSALTPLVGVGVITVDRMYPTVLGANIGTCITGVLAALAADSSKLYLTLQVAYSHLLFNISGIVLWYVIWPLRAVPINAAKFLGNTTAKYRWFAVAYLISCFFFIPAIIMGISLGSSAAAAAVVIVFVVICLFIALISMAQTRKPELLPAKFRTWEFLPVWMRSLEPLDRVVCGPLNNACCKWAPCKAKPKVVKRQDNKPIELEVASMRLQSSAASAVQQSV